MKFDVAILGGGPSGLMIARRIGEMFPEMSKCIIDPKGVAAGDGDFIFHLHRPINDIPYLTESENPVTKKFTAGFWDGKLLKAEPSLKDVNDYSMKIFGVVRINNIINQGGFSILPIKRSRILSAIRSGVSFETIQQAATSISFQSKTIGLDKGGAVQYDYLVSTIPLPVLLRLAGVSAGNGIKFENFPFWGCQVRVEKTECYQVIMNTSREGNSTRITLFDDLLFVELCAPEILETDRELIQSVFKVDTSGATVFKIVPGRFNPLAREIRKPLLHWLTERHNVLLLGRYGAWTYKISNDVWEDTKFLCSLIHSKNQSAIYEKGIHP